MVLVHLSLGSNLGNSIDLLEKACSRLKQLPLLKMRRSSILQSPPLMGMDQPEYLNQVVCGFTDMEPETLLRNCSSIESALGRIREKHWGPRTMDIDILSYGNRVIQTESLRIPHPELENRSFVLMLLREISPEWAHPSSGLSIGQLWEKWRQSSSEPVPKIFKTRTSL